MRCYNTWLCTHAVITHYNMLQHALILPPDCNSRNGLQRAREFTDGRDGAKVGATVIERSLHGGRHIFESFGALRSIQQR